jgi:peptidoglycan/LPS O-acetylase OafA/YrhL
MKFSTRTLLNSHRSVPDGVSRQLDTFRGLSAIAVLLGHASQVFIARWEPGMHVLFGLAANVAVMVFFALSGFLICKSITGNVARNGRFVPGEYAQARFNRIVPPFLAAMLLAVALWWLAPLVFPGGTRTFLPVAPHSARVAFELDARSLLGTLFFVNGFLAPTVSLNGPLWSLSFEVWYYVAAGIAAMSLGSGWILSAALVLGLGLLSKTFPVLSIVWFAGAAIALAHDHRVDRSSLCRALGFVSLLAAAGAAVMFVLHAKANGRWLLAFQLSSGVVFACVLHRIVTGRSGIRPVFSRSADFSYSLYIVHFPILLFLYGIAGQWRSTLAECVLWAIGGSCACLVVAYSLRGVERIKPLGRARKLPARHEHVGVEVTVGQPGTGKDAQDRGDRPHPAASGVGEIAPLREIDP